MADDDQRTYHRKLVEAALFASGKAMSVDELGKALGILSPGYLRKILDQLVEEYTAKDSAIIVFKAGEKYMMGVREPYSSKVSDFAGQPDISKGALRILAYISKNEPIMQNSVVKAFGSSTYDYIRELTEKDFISATKTGRTKKLETTNTFKEYFV
ncbi:MAG: SMC-Scp complex subunit ScpB, partial [Candidatus Micrarchaeota archaeon]|nr:SMC-Scp complex subunit ScpB [Candidatus Micrarchaeota archaeon]